MTQPNQQGAVGLLSVVLLTTLVLIFTLTVSIQVLLNIKNAKINSDFNQLYYATEGGLRDARMQLKLEDVLTKTYQNTAISGLTVTRSADIGLASIEVHATGTSASIQRSLTSPCTKFMMNCSVTEQLP